MSVFQTNCSLPGAGTRFVESPDSRGTLDILWSCLGVLLLCTWSIQHPPVPIQSHPRTIRQHVNNVLRDYRSKILWMVVTLMAPELLCGVAAEEWLTACRSAQKAVVVAKSESAEWTASHSFYSQMGGFRLQFSDLGRKSLAYMAPSARTSTGSFGKCDTSTPKIVVTSPSNLKSLVSTEKEEPNLSPLSPSTTGHFSSLDSAERDFQKVLARHLTQSVSLGELDWQVDGFNTTLVEQLLHRQSPANCMKTLSTAIEMTADTWILSPKQVILAKEYGLIEAMPSTTKDELNALSNNDSLAKGLAVAQVLWLLIQMTSRAASSLTISQLEIATAAFSVCTFVTYIFLWQKPQGVTTVVYLQARRRPTAEELWHLAEHALENTSSLKYRARSWRQSRQALRAREFSNTVMLLSAAALGAVHCAAWNSTFPTAIEKLVWRICALGSTALPILLLSWHELYLRREFVRHAVFSGFVLVGFALYGLMRMFIMVDMFRCLLFLPPDAFRTTWTINLPGIS